jgi:hypothetical protein
MVTPQTPINARVGGRAVVCRKQHKISTGQGKGKRQALCTKAYELPFVGSHVMATVETYVTQDFISVASGYLR